MTWKEGKGAFDGEEMVMGCNCFFFLPSYFFGGFSFFEVVIPVVTSEIALTPLTA